MKHTLQDEYKLLGDELRQNRQIQLNAYLSAPIWMSIFFGLVSKETYESIPIMILLPVVMMLANLLLIADRRKSADVIIAYIRVAHEKSMAEKPQWHVLLPNFRKEYKKLQTKKIDLYIPQRFDFHVAVWLTFLALSLICAITFTFLSTFNFVYSIFILVIVIFFYIMILQYHYQLSLRKSILLKAWEQTLTK